MVCGHVEEQCNVGSIILKHNLGIRLGIYGSKTKFSPMYPKYDIFAQSKLKRRKITFFILTYIIASLRTAAVSGSFIFNFGENCMPSREGVKGSGFQNLKSFSVMILKNLKKQEVPSLIMCSVHARETEREIADYSILLTFKHLN